MSRVTGHVVVGGEQAGSASIRIRVADPALAASLETAIADAVGATLAATPAAPVPSVAVASTSDVARAVGAVATIAVTRANRAEILGLAEAAETAGAAGVQLVWNGRPRNCEAAVFAVLEAWRGASRRCPLMLAPTADPAPELLRAIARRRAAAGAEG